MKSATFTVLLNKVADIQRFVQLTNEIPNIIDASQGRYNLNAKSINGLFCLDLEKPIKLTVYGETAREFLYKLENFNVN